VGTEYIFQLCFGKGTFKRGEILTFEEDDNPATIQMTWKNVVSLANATLEDLDWWSFVENDPIALSSFGK
jgi:hypothetical protein